MKRKVIILIGFAVWLAVIIWATAALMTRFFIR